MAMFSNQQQYAQQIGGMNTGPGMQNPFPDSGDAGARIAGGMGMALPGIATGLSIGGGLMGGAAGWADPMTGVARGFASGVGMGGAGMGTTLGHVGRTFATGGLRAGAGLMAGGMAGAAAMALPYYVAGKAIQTVGENVYAGAQNIAEVGGMANQYMGSQYGEPGARSGGQMGRENIKRIVGAMREIVSDDTKTSMDELKKVMDQAGRMGMLQGIGSAQEFKSRFQKIVRQVRDVADIMGTSLEEAAPVMGKMRQMGLWNTGDVMGTVVQARAAGGAAPQMIQSMQTGAQISHAMGGTMRAGAMMGQNTFTTMQAAQRAGVLSEEDIMEFTGGVGGAEGKRVMAQRMTGIMSQFSQSSAGRLMMAGLGQTKEGKFTGEIDKEKLAAFQRGEISVNDLQRMGQKASRGREGAMSFFRHAETMGQNLGAEGGMEAITQVVQQVADTQFGGSEEARHQLFQQMTGMSNRDAEMFGKLADESAKIKDQKLRSTSDALKQAFDAMEQKNLRSWDAMKGAMSKVWDDTMAPLQEAGERMATDFGEVGDKIADMWSGRTRTIAMGSQERGRLLRRSLTQDFEDAVPSGLGQEWMSGGVGSNMIMRMRQPGFAGKMWGQAAAGSAIGGAVIPGGQIMGGMAGAGAALFGFGEDMSPRAQMMREIGVGTMGGGGDVEMGGGYTTSRTEMKKGIRRAYMRAQSPSKSVLGIDDEAKLSKVRMALKTAIGQNSAELRSLKKKDPQAYRAKLMEYMGKADGEVWKSMEGREMSDMDKLDYLAVAQNEEGFGSSELAVDFQGAAGAVGMLPTDPQELAKMQKGLISDLAGAAGHRNIVEEMAKGAAVGMAVPLVGPLLGAVGGLTKALVEDTGISEGDIEAAMTGEAGGVVMGYLKTLRGEEGGTSYEDAITSLSRMKGGDRVARVLEQIHSDPAAQETFAKKGGVFEQMRAKQAWDQVSPSLRNVAVKNRTEVQGLEGRAQKRFADIVRLMRGGQDEELSAGEWRQATSEAGDLAGSITGEQAAALEKGGGALGRQVVALREAGQMAGGLEGKELQSKLARFRRLGYDVEQMGGERVKELLKGGIQGSEMAEFRDKVGEAIKAGLAETAAGKKSANEQMQMLLDRYTDYNTKFVNAVSSALGKEGIDLKEEAGNMSRDNTAASPAARE